MVNGIETSRIHLLSSKLSPGRFSLVGRSKLSLEYLLYSSSERNEVIFATKDHSIHFIDVMSKERIVKLKAHKHAISCLELHPRGTYLVSCSSDVCILWDMKTRNKIKNFAMMDFQALKACFVPDGNTLIVLSKSSEILLLHFPTLQVRSRLICTSHEGSKVSLKNLVVTSSGKYFVVVSHDGSAYVWDLVSESLIDEFQLPSALGDNLSALQPMYFGQTQKEPESHCIACLCGDSQLRVFQVPEGLLLFSCDVPCHAFSIIGRRVALCCPDSTLKLCELRGRKVKATGKEVNISLLHRIEPTAATSEFEREEEEEEEGEGEGEGEGMVQDENSRPVRQEGRKGVSSVKKRQEVDTDPAYSDWRRRKERLLAFLDIHDNFPERFREQVYRQLLRLPRNQQAFNTLVNMGLHPLATSQALPRRPRPRQLFWPSPPVHLLSTVERLLFAKDSQLFRHLDKIGLKPQDYMWPLLRSAFSEVLDRNSWLHIMDHILVKPTSFIYCVLVAFLVHSRAAIMSLKNQSQMNLFLTRANPVDAKDEAQRQLIVERQQQMLRELDEQEAEREEAENEWLQSRLEREELEQLEFQTFLHFREGSQKTIQKSQELGQQAELEARRRMQQLQVKAAEERLMMEETNQHLALHAQTETKMTAECQMKLEDERLKSMLHSIDLKRRARLLTEEQSSQAQRREDEEARLERTMVAQEMRQLEQVVKYKDLEMQKMMTEKAEMIRAERKRIEQKKARNRIRDFESQLSREGAAWKLAASHYEQEVEDNLLSLQAERKQLEMLDAEIAARERELRMKEEEAQRGQQEERSARESQERTAGDDIEDSSGNSSEWLVGMAKAAREEERSGREKELMGRERREEEEEERRRKRPGERGYWQMRAQLAGVELGRKEEGFKNRQETGVGGN
ncbi:hypothetical protein GUITHDRAFT_143473 [Guillardia theta CCMP2712]|uniref:TBC1 domain family member 31 n=1 Tax=Guillardia theta (strain CCMP2712) TaxID=905079 RepID=L1ITB8_GUITC|nr:hypothetical protein GUITHDRAFT_143473 [Guillardia theta CCMP2712]EKX39478.1 hypothetical protein GUITHDRAFT_143473 [Guillardia theta CCMP2712]|eukprot:XP_005826458.1 hypothetical protein GUITHDRAFT_143473 [Guillardia theta CCMP2712]